MWSYKARHRIINELTRGHRKRENLKESPGNEVEVVWACDANIGTLCRKDYDGNGRTKAEGEMKTQEKMVGHKEGWHQRKGTVGEEVYDGATWRRIVKHRPHIKLGLR